MNTKIAGKDEVLEFYTSLLRREKEEYKLSDAVKAAEFFSKYYGLTEKSDCENDVKVVIIDNIPCGGDDNNGKVSER